jgi:dihydrofolate reductase
MSKVVFDISMSLDGFMTAANQRPEEPLGEGGEQLHRWAFGEDPSDREVLTGGASSLGAVICGRRTYDDSLPWWGADGPTGPARLPVLVLSHDEPADTAADGVYTFVTGGIEDALKQAREAAGGQTWTRVRLSGQGCRARARDPQVAPRAGRWGAGWRSPRRT